MKRRLVRIGAGIVLCLGLCARAADAGGLPPDMGEYVLALLYKGPKWSAEVTEESKKIQAAHMETIGKLVSARALAFAGPTDGAGDLRGIFVFNLTSTKQAEDAVKADPAIKSGRLRAEFHLWYGPAGLATILKQAARR